MLDKKFERVEYRKKAEIKCVHKTFMQRLIEELKENKLARVCLIMLVLIVAAVILAPLVPYDPDGIDDEILYGQYLLEYFGNYTKQKEQGLLKYQIEYILYGHDSTNPAIDVF